MLVICSRLSNNRRQLSIEKFTTDHFLNLIIQFPRELDIFQKSFIKKITDKFFLIDCIRGGWGKMVSKNLINWFFFVGFLITMSSINLRIFNPKHTWGNMDQLKNLKKKYFFIYLSWNYKIFNIGKSEAKWTPKGKMTLHLYYIQALFS